VFSIGKLAPGGEQYYLQSVAKGLEDYYLGAGEAPGFWLGLATRGRRCGQIPTRQTDTNKRTTVTSQGGANPWSISSR
jgi:hypothetical protein